MKGATPRRRPLKAASVTNAPLRGSEPRDSSVPTRLPTSWGRNGSRWRATPRSWGRSRTRASSPSSPSLRRVASRRRKRAPRIVAYRRTTPDVRRLPPSFRSQPGVARGRRVPRHLRARPRPPRDGARDARRPSPASPSPESDAMTLYLRSRRRVISSNSPRDASSVLLVSRRRRSLNPCTRSSSCSL